jgi:hypothetical protein
VSAVAAHAGVDPASARRPGKRGEVVHAILDGPLCVNERASLGVADRVTGEAVCGEPGQLGEFGEPSAALWDPVITCPCLRGPGPGLGHRPGRVHAVSPSGRGGEAHQLQIAPTPDLRTIAVSCTCRAAAEAGALGVRPRWAGGEAYRAWLTHLEAEAEPEAGI